MRRLTGPLVVAAGCAGSLSVSFKLPPSGCGVLRRRRFSVDLEPVIGPFVALRDAALGRDQPRFAAAPAVAAAADNIDRIAVVVREFAARFDVVITTGGVGPTHDDCTWRAVAMAVDDDFVLRQEVLDMMEARAGRALTPEQQRMALLPSRAVVERLDRGWALRVDAIWVLPGVPSMVMAKIDAICSRYAAPQPHLCEVIFSASGPVAGPIFDRSSRSP